VSSHKLSDNTGWELAFLGEITSTDRNVLKNIHLSGIPNLCVCIESLLTLSEAWCTKISSFNYYADLKMRITAPIHHLHFWLQLDLNGGKLIGSDSFIYLNAEDEDNSGGFSIHSNTIGKWIEFNIKMGQTQNFNERIEKISEQIFVLTKQTLQQHTRLFCLNHMLSTTSCGDYTAKLNYEAKQVLRKIQFNLPSKQLIPSPKYPFVFLHIEKCAGTTLRE
jgi:hypothetical protein